MKIFLLRSRIFTFTFILGIFSTQTFAQVDDDLTDKTKALLANLKQVEASNNFLFGQEFFNSFKFISGSAHGDKETSDAKSVTGSHPALLGSDFHYYIEKNDTERGYHREAVKWAFQQGYVITFDWHISAKGTSSYEYTAGNAALVSDIVNDLNGARTWLYGELDKAIEIMNEELVVGNDTIPIVFRPWHEMNGGWFWWGTSGASAANYKLLYQLTVNYIKERTKTVLFCWSPNAPFGDARYPGDEYVDVVGVDLYEATTTSLRSEIGKVVDFAQLHDKIAVMSETGDRNSAANSPLYWKNTILPGILEDPSGKAKKIAWVLTWINASWSVPYVAHPSSSTTVKQSFTDFKNSTNVIFGGEAEMPSMYTEPVLVSTPEDQVNSVLQVFPNPAEDQLTIRFSHEAKNFTVRIYNSAGKMIHAIRNPGKDVTLNTKASFSPGLYIIKASDQKKVITKKVWIK